MNLKLDPGIISGSHSTHTENKTEITNGSLLFSNVFTKLKLIYQPYPYLEADQKLI